LFTFNPWRNINLETKAQWCAEICLILPMIRSYRSERQVERKKEKTMNIFVGNLSHQTAVDDLRAAFESHGKVDSANIIKDKMSGESKGFGFVEMPNQSEAEAAISNLNGRELDGRAMTVNVAKPRTEGRRSGGGTRY